MIDLLLWLSLAAVGLIVAGLGSGLETGIYSLNPVRLHVLEYSASAQARLLARHMKAPAALIASMLIIHNAGVKLATHACAVVLRRADLTEWQVIGFDALIMMPLLFVFAETVPKNLFALYADRLMYAFARPVAVFVWACHFSGLVLLLTGASNLFIRLLDSGGPMHAFHPRHQVQTLVREGLGQGLLDDEQLAITERTMSLAGRTVQQQMQPWRHVVRIDSSERPEHLYQRADQLPHTRFPVTDRATGNVVGVLNITDVLVHDPARCPPVAELMRPAPMLDEATSLRQALTALRYSDLPMAIVTRHGRPVGIVTLKDLIEPITGELAAW